MHLTAQSKCFFQYVVHFLLEIFGFAAVFFLFMANFPSFSDRFSLQSEHPAGI